MLWVGMMPSLARSESVASFGRHNIIILAASGSGKLFLNFCERKTKNFLAHLHILKNFRFMETDLISSSDHLSSPPPSRRFSYINATATERGLEPLKEYDLNIVLEEPETISPRKIEEPSVPVAAIVGTPREPMKTFCPKCHEYIVTKVKKKYVPSKMAWCGFGFCLLIG